MMDATQFYTTEEGKAIALHLVTPMQSMELLESCTEAERNYLSLRQFKGNLGDSCLIFNAQGEIEKAYIGSGGNDQQALAQAAILLPPGVYKVQAPLTQEAMVYWALAQYRFTRYKASDLASRVLVLAPHEFQDVLSLVSSLYLVRDLINTPSNDMGPKELGEVVQQLGTNHGAEVRVWEGDELLEDNFPAIHAVGRASSEAPRLISLTWGEKSHPLVTLIGKGVSFDSGGLDLKPSSAMRLMKKDMGGSAHVIGLAQWIMLKRLPIRLNVLIPAVENAIGPNAFRPGDVLTMRNGLSVEIDNTDAEGRLVLADALVKACEEKPALIIDFATLTGAARVAVGTEIAALFSNDDVVADAMCKASIETQDPIWRLPLFNGYEELLNSSIADLVNSSPSSYAGAIVAGLFLQRFVTPSIPWVHFDVMAWNVANKPGKPEGGEAMALRAVARFLEQRFSA